MKRPSNLTMVFVSGSLVGELGWVGCNVSDKSQIKCATPLHPIVVAGHELRKLQMLGFCTFDCVMASQP